MNEQIQNDANEITKLVNSAGIKTGYPEMEFLTDDKIVANSFLLFDLNQNTVKSTRDTPDLDRKIENDTLVKQ